MSERASERASACVSASPTPTHLHAEGSWGADEILAGRDPTRGAELCDIVEAVYSIEWSFRQVGAPLAPLPRITEETASSEHNLPKGG